ncbi:oleate hydratase [Acidovorax sp. NCPPB 2350]|nr:oleate hydratase [Acidovorax sp. NCPPB 2350]
MSNHLDADDVLHVAIIGGGISGLASAYYLMQRARHLGARLDIHVFEAKQTLGGNADTVVVDLARSTGEEAGELSYLRWADLGVNDANLATYERMHRAMEDVGYLDHMRPLSDTKCCFGPDGATLWTDGAGECPDTATGLAHSEGGLLAPLIRTVHRAAMDLRGHITLDYTCARFFQDCLDDPEGMLGEAARGLGIAIDWASAELPGRIVRARDHYYYPRIAAMYFADPDGPGGMPLKAPLEYFRLQEGSESPRRCYFDHGSQKWIETLAANLEARSDGQVAVSIWTGERAQVRVMGDAVEVMHAGQTRLFDLCVMANHADDAMGALSFDTATAAFGARVGRILDSVRYARSYAVCHTCADLLPDEPDDWRTYNIAARPADARYWPYHINYVVNFHQNDAEHPQVCHDGAPAYFVSLVDDLRAIPREDMLDRVAGISTLPASLRDAIPASTLRQMEAGAFDAGYRDPLQSGGSELQNKAWAAFKHNVLDASCMQAQVDIRILNETFAQGWSEGEGRVPCAAVPPLLFVGGWTHGAGLLEQCMAQAEELSDWVLPH